MRGSRTDKAELPQNRDGIHLLIKKCSNL